MGSRTVVAAALSPLALNITVRAVDAGGNSLGILDTHNRSILLSAMDPSTLYGFFAAQSAFARSVTRQRSMRLGVVRYDDVILQSPMTGAMMLYFFDVASLTKRDVVELIVTPGRPSRIVYDPLSLLLVSRWRAGVVAATVLEPFSVVVADEAGNAITDPSSGPDSVTLTVGNQRPTSSGVAAAYVLDISAFLDKSGVYTFSLVVLRATLGGTSIMTFNAVSPTFGALNPPLMTVVPAMWCSSDEFAVVGSFRCARCPLHATCDGTDSIVVAPGFWHQQVTSTHIFPCSPADSCADARNCAEGYEGAYCGSCASGYGRQLGSCAACGSKTTTWVFVGCVVGVAVILFWLLSAQAAPFTSAVDADVRLVTVDTTNTISVVIKIAVSHLQTLSLLPLEVLPLAWVSSTARSGSALAMVMPDFVNIGCAIGRRTADELRGYLWLIAIVLPACCFLGFVRALLDAKRFRKQALIVSAAERAAILRGRGHSAMVYKLVDNARIAADVAACVGKLAERRECINAVTSHHMELTEGEYPGDRDHGRVPVSLAVLSGDSEDIPHNPPKPSLKERFLNIAIVTAAVVLVTLYPTITLAAIHVLQCSTLQLTDTFAQRVMKLDTIVDCTSPEYAYMQYQAVITLAAVGVGVPLLAPLSVVATRWLTCNGRLDRAKQLLSFLTGGYRLWFWESVSITRKAVLVLVASLIDDTQGKSLGFVWTMLTSLAMNLFFRPWESKRLQTLEAVSFASLLLTSLSLAVISLPVTGSSTAAQIFLTIVVIVAQFTAILLFVVEIAVQLFGKVKALLPHELGAILTRWIEPEHVDEHRSAVRQSHGRAAELEELLKWYRTAFPRLHRSLKEKDFDQTADAFAAYDDADYDEVLFDDIEQLCALTTLPEALRDHTLCLGFDTHLGDVSEIIRKEREGSFEDAKLRYELMGLMVPNIAKRVTDYQWAEIDVDNVMLEPIPQELVMFEEAISLGSSDASSLLNILDNDAVFFDSLIGVPQDHGVEVKVDLGEGSSEIDVSGLVTSRRPTWGAGESSVNMPSILQESMFFDKFEGLDSDTASETDRIIKEKDRTVGLIRLHENALEVAWRHWLWLLVGHAATRPTEALMRDVYRTEIVVARTLHRLARLRSRERFIATHIASNSQAQEVCDF